MMWHGHGYGWWGLLVGGLVMVLFWGGIIFSVVWAAKAVFQKGHQFGEEGKPTSALDILDQRYAKGEIDKETYQEMKADIKN